MSTTWTARPTSCNTDRALATVIDAALVRGGYTDNRLLGARFLQALANGQSIYEIRFRGETGPEFGRVFVKLINGQLVGEF